MLIIAAIVILVLIGVDQAIKIWAIQELKPVGSMDFLHIGDFDIMDLTYLENTGSAFGSFAGHRVLLLTVTIIGAAACIWILIRHAQKKPFLFWSLVLVIAGGLGNMIDRIFRGGAVVDYLDLQLFDFAIFNFADCCVSVGTVLLFIYIIFMMDKKPKETKTDEEVTDGTA
ncbi:MAG: signal peptidase II [Oscillospiraceae bacterium]|nr:signal peptidase II [Oscillospiraceae bacterium]